jgi:hypothetical protein
MRKAEEYWNKVSLPFHVLDIVKSKILEAIRTAQIDAIEETVKLCAENAEIEERDYRKNPTKVENYGQEVSSEYEGIYYGVDAQSILNCAEILKKEL